MQSSIFIKPTLIKNVDVQPKVHFNPLFLRRPAIHFNPLFMRRRTSEQQQTQTVQSPPRFDPYNTRPGTCDMSDITPKSMQHKVDHPDKKMVSSQFISTSRTPAKKNDTIIPEKHILQPKLAPGSGIKCTVHPLCQHFWRGEGSDAKCRHQTRTVQSPPRFDPHNIRPGTCCTSENDATLQPRLASENITISDSMRPRTQLLATTNITPNLKRARVDDPDKKMVSNDFISTSRIPAKENDTTTREKHILQPKLAPASGIKRTVRPLCQNFWRGACWDTKCLLFHTYSVSKMPMCKYVFKTLCPQDKCPYSHKMSSNKNPFCLDFLNGYCKRGGNCYKRHEFLCPEFERTGVCRIKNCEYCFIEKVRGTRKQEQEAREVGNQQNWERPKLGQDKRKEKQPPAKRRYFDESSPTGIEETGDITMAQKRIRIYEWLASIPRQRSI